MKGHPLLVRGLLTAALLALAACRSSVPTAEPAVEPGATARSETAQRPAERALIVEGAPSSEEAGLERAIAPLAEGYARSGRRSYVDDAAYEARLHLRRRGYASAEVTYEILGTGLARLTVRAGSRAILGEVSVVVEGRSSIEDDDLARYVTGPRTGLFGSGPTLYVARRVASAADAIEEDLIALGHLDADARVVDPGPGPGGDPVDVRVEVDPGPLYRVGEVTFGLARTAEGLSDETEAAVLAALADVVGRMGEERTFRPRMVNRLRGAIIDALGQRGHPDAGAEVSVDVDRRTRHVNLAVVAEPGPYVVLGEVHVQGEVRTRASFLASRMRIQRGDVYDSSKLRKSLRNLYRTGLFRQVTASLEGEGEMRSVLVDVIERPSVEVYAEPGFGSYELGRLTRRRARPEPDGARDQRERGGDRGRPRRTRQREPLRPVVPQPRPDRRRARGLRPARGALLHTPAPRRRRLPRQAMGCSPRDHLRLSLRTLVRDGRRGGGRGRARRPVAGQRGGADRDPALRRARRALRPDPRRLRGGLARVRPPGARLRARVRALAALDRVLRGAERGGRPRRRPAHGRHRAGLRRHDDPAAGAFLRGGENSVRSFRESRLGPSDADGEPLGGEAFGTLSLEWRHELGGAFQSALFADAGYVEAQAEDLFALDDVRTGVGVGLRYLLPIGPLRLDAAFNPDRRAGEAEWVVHFAIGMPF